MSVILENYVIKLNRKFKIKYKDMHVLIYIGASNSLLDIGYCNRKFKSRKSFDTTEKSKIKITNLKFN